MVRRLAVAGEESALSGPARFRVFGAGGFAGNPVTLIECAALNDGAALLARAREQRTVDSAFHARGPAAPWRVRFFSHSGEVQLCGHALLALAWHLRDSPSAEPLRIESAHERHEVRWRDGSPWVSLPERPCASADDRLLRGLLEGAGLRVEHLARGEGNVWLAHCDSADAIAAFDRESFDWQGLALLAPGALILTASLGPRRYALRYFAPWHGKPEDSATGSAQCVLAPYWLGEEEEGEARQLSPAGEAVIKVAREGGRVWVSGRVESADGA